MLLPGAAVIVREYSRPNDVLLGYQSVGRDAARSRADERLGTFGFAATVAARGGAAYKRVAELSLHRILNSPMADF